MAEALRVDLRVDVLHQLHHQLGLVEGVQIVPALLPDLPRELGGGVEGGGAEEGGGAVDAGHDGLGQAALLKVVCGDLPDRGVTSTAACRL